MATSNRRHQLIGVLNQFYAQPVARVSFELLISILVIVFFAAFAIRPTLLTMSDLIKEIDEKRTLDKALGQKISALGSAQGEFQSLQSRLVVLDEAIPSQPDLVSGLKILEKIASDQNLAITALTVSKIPPEPTEPIVFPKAKRLNTLTTVTVTGDYPTIRQFVEELRNSRRAFLVESINFSTGDEQGERVLKASLSINMPYFGVEATAASDALNATARSGTTTTPAGGN